MGMENLRLKAVNIIFGYKTCILLNESFNMIQQILFYLEGLHETRLFITKKKCIKPLLEIILVLPEWGQRKYRTFYCAIEPSDDLC